MKIVFEEMSPRGMFSVYQIYKLHVIDNKRISLKFFQEPISVFYKRKVSIE